MNSLLRISFINSISRICFHELICEFVNIWKGSYEFAPLHSGLFLQNQCHVVNGLYRTSKKLAVPKNYWFLEFTTFSIPNELTQILIHRNIQLKLMFELKILQILCNNIYAWSIRKLKAKYEVLELDFKMWQCLLSRLWQEAGILTEGCKIVWRKAFSW